MKPVRNWLVASLILPAAAACAPKDSGETPGTSAKAVEQASSPAGAPPVDQTLPQGVRVGADYALARQALLEAGWLPLQDLACTENVGGAAVACGRLPELEACSGDGHCALNFADATGAKRVRISTTGDASQWPSGGEGQDVMRVEDFGIRDVSDVQQATCPAKDFDGFLVAFASDAKIRVQHTQPLQKINAVLEDGERETPYVAWVASRGDSDFALRHRNDGFHVLMPDGQLDPALVTPEVKAATGGYDVAYVYGMSEGARYHFKRHGDCWSLIGASTSAN